MAKDGFKVHYSGASLQNPLRAVITYDDFPPDTEIIPIQLIAADGAPSRGIFYRKRGTRPKIGVHAMHSRSDQSLNYGIPKLVEAGYAVLGRAGRYPNNDVDTVHETLLLDFAAGVRFLRQQGAETVVLYGMSGGSALAAFYQWQALKPIGERLTHTPAGDPFDLNAHDLPVADAIAFLAPHAGEGAVLEKMIDPAVVDEDDPLLTDSSLDLYDPANGFREPPHSSSYSEEFLARYRAGQAARIQRLDARARALVNFRRAAAEVVAKLDGAATLAQLRAAHVERHMLIYRTTADPAMVDLSIEPDDRIVGTYASAKPHLENFGRDGFARYITPRAWLSTWSPLSSKVRTIDNLAEITTPLIVVHYAGDCGTRLSEAQAMVDRCGAQDKQLHIVRGVNHYGKTIDTDERAMDSLGLLIAWIDKRFDVSAKRLQEEEELS